jgi:microcystin-dependent protein
MSEPEPYLSQIMLFPFNWAPRGYALCDGQTIQISENQALYALLGTNFGGDGTRTFGLPDLRGRAAVGTGDASFYPDTLYPGMKMGTESVNLTLEGLPRHTHALQASTDDADIHIPSNAFLANIKPVSGAEFPLYSSNPPANSITSLSDETCGYTGGALSHDNMQPSIVINYCIAITGVFPSRN